MQLNIIEPYYKCLDTSTSTIMITVYAGSIYENAKTAGISHLLEHLTFNDSDFDTSYKILGGINAYTSNDQIVYVISLPDKYLKEGIELLFKITLRNKIVYKTLVKERKVVLEEHFNQYQQRANQLYEDLTSKVFDGHPLGNMVSPKNNVIGTVSLKTIAEYKHEYFNINNMHLTICSYISQDKIRKIVEKIQRRYLHKIGKNKDDAISPFLLTKSIYTSKPHIVLRNLNGDIQSNVIIAFSSEVTKNVLLPNFLAYILANSASSIMFKRLRTEKRLIYSVKCLYESYRYGDLFMISCTVKQDNIWKLLREIFKILRSPIRISNKRFEIAKKNYLHIYKLTLQQNQIYTAFIAKYGIKPDQYIDELSKLTKEDFIQMKSKYMQFDGRMGIGISGIKFVENANIITEHVNRLLSYGKK